jgi:hypothetical protein
MEVAAAGQERTTMPRLNPDLAGIQRERLSRLREALVERDDPEALGTLRALVGRVEVPRPTGSKEARRIERQGERAALLRAAGWRIAEQQTGPVPGGMGPDLLQRSAKLDAGTRKRLELLLKGQWRNR